MNASSRRDFLANIGQGMLVGTVGLHLASDLGLVGRAWGDEIPARLTFGRLDALVDLIQETAPDALLPLLTERIRAGESLRDITAATALANCRRFAGNDYIGYHTFMALAPAYRMSQRLPAAMAPLPVLKVVHRNATRIQDDGGPLLDHMHPLEADASASSHCSPEELRGKIRAQHGPQAEKLLAAIANNDVGEAFNHLQFAIQDEVDVHRIVIPWRAWETLQIAGPEHAATLLRQSVRFCVDAERDRTTRGGAESELRLLLPRLLDQFKLVGRPLGDGTLDDARIHELALTIFGKPRNEAAESVAATLAEGISAEAIGEAISLAACWLVLHDPGREVAEPGKPIGSVHGASVGVHASDSANAWRNVARVSNDRNKVASLIAAAFHTAGQNQRSNPKPWPLDADLRPIDIHDPDRLLVELDGAIRENNQSRACALVRHYGDLKHSAPPVFELFLRFATSEDGQLHAEKYFQTVCEEHESLRESVRWQHVCALARVTASEYGTPSPGYQLGRKLLGV